jgi:hypothetical protein
MRFLSVHGFVERFFFIICQSAKDEVHALYPLSFSLCSLNLLSDEPLFDNLDIVDEPLK